MKSIRVRLLLLLFLVTLSVLGCASKSAYVIARRDPQHTPASTNKIALAHQNQARPQDQELGCALIAALKQRGFRIVPQADADYTLTYSIENDWRTRKTIVHTVEPALGPGYMPQVPFYGAPHTLIIPYQYQTARIVDEQVPAQGIRLQLYSRESIRAGRLQAAWDGYIDGGPKLAPKRQPILLKTLLTYFGQDFSGRTPLRQPEAE